jgi:hypothetical protein
VTTYGALSKCPEGKASFVSYPSQPMLSPERLAGMSWIAPVRCFWKEATNMLTPNSIQS